MASRLSRTLLATLAVAALSLAALAATAGAAQGARTASARALTTWHEPLLREINAARAAHGRAPVRASRRLDLAATRHSLTLARLGVLSHVSPDGSTFQQRVAAAGYRGEAVGEDLAYAGSPRQTVRLWLESAPHREVLLSARSRTIGLGLAAAAYGNGRKVFVTADFGR